MRYAKINSELFVANRQRFASKMGKGSFMVILGADFVQRNSDCNYRVRQNSDFFYLSGIDQEKTALLIDKSSSGVVRNVLFILKASKELLIWEGHKLSKGEATEISGIEEVRYVDSLDDEIDRIASKRQVFYYVEEGNPRTKKSNHSPHYYLNDKFKRRLKSSFKNLRYFSSKEIFAELRLIKSEMEISLIRKACEITSEAFSAVLRNTKREMMEYEIEALITSVFISKGANGHAYDPIVAGGEHACVLHYTENDAKLRNKDLLLLDFGAEYGNYAADLSRTIPVSGKFSKRQRAVYQSVLNVFKLARNHMVPGNTIEFVQKEVVKALEKELVILGLIKESQIGTKAGASPAFRKYFMHGIGHFLGLDVHDVGDRQKVFEKGMVLTCEPGIYIEEEGIGVRIENDILITENGNEDLMKSTPIEVDEIEAEMSI